MSAPFFVAGFVQTGAGIVTGTGESTKFMGLLMGKINGKELEKRCETPSRPTHAPEPLHEQSPWRQGWGFSKTRRSVKFWLGF